MSAAFAPLLAALDAAPGPVNFFLRDDDAGWDDARLFALLDCSERAGVPIDLALIPRATGAALATSLAARKAAAPRLIGLHQHGFAHTNHEVAPQRNCEFGSARSRHTQWRDLSEGRERLQQWFGAQLDPIFTPPWNRCSTLTPALLVELGFAALSRSRGAAPQADLPELPIDVDWCKQQHLAHEHGAADGCAHIAGALARRIVEREPEGPVGLMLHHAAMDDADLALLDALFRTTQGHRQVRWRPMRELLPATPPDKEYP